jgi:hypothetical protein
MMLRWVDGLVAKVPEIAPFGIVWTISQNLSLLGYCRAFVSR